MCINLRDVPALHVWTQLTVQLQQVEAQALALCSGTVHPGAMKVKAYELRNKTSKDRVDRGALGDGSAVSHWIVCLCAHRITQKVWISKPVISLRPLLGVYPSFFVF